MHLTEIGAEFYARCAHIAKEAVEAERLDVGLVEQWLGHRNDVAALESLIGGGLVVGSTALRERLLQGARSLIFTTGCAPPTAGALAAAVVVVSRRRRGRREVEKKKARRF